MCNQQMPRKPSVQRLLQCRSQVIRVLQKQLDPCKVYR